MSYGRVAVKHDQRQGENLPNNVRRDLTKNNVYLKTCSDFKEEFNAVFAKDVAEYNAGRRKDRQISDYYEKIASNEGKANMPKTAYEYVFQFGNMENNNVNDPKFQKVNEDSKEMLIELDKRFNEKYPNFHVASSVVHMDEATPHLHLTVIPVADGYKNGMKHQCSLTKALNNMGYENKTEVINGKKTQVLAVKQWQDDVKETMQEIMEEYGYEREYMNNTEKHLDVPTYKLKKRKEEQEKALEQQEKSLEMAKEKSNEFIKSKTIEINALKAQKMALTEENEGLKEENQKLTEDNEELKERKKALDERETAVTERERAADERERALDERERKCGLYERLRTAEAISTPTMPKSTGYDRFAKAEAALGKW